MTVVSPPNSRSPLTLDTLRRYAVARTLFRPTTLSRAVDRLGCKMGYYALPLLWRDQIIGWGNLRVEQGRLVAELGYVTAPPRSRAFKSALEAEQARMSQFLSL